MLNFLYDIFYGPSSPSKYYRDEGYGYEPRTHAYARRSRSQRRTPPTVIASNRSSERRRSSSHQHGS
ncbi:hypothetical protein DOTSEDRAFT_44097 [Dothistroma septosporum NZE10]|uniref:Uncharacterized protein n=1 Tax=Dothistroma septosporum (strain NZE10 / CBS 128990) TaxID=675120 RepID=N1PTW7_DOTSN|nr:hypothetical protein DOTSEDRAFT_44097 [Dothistroma septosporum NZE10]